VSNNKIESSFKTRRLSVFKTRVECIRPANKNFADSYSLAVRKTLEYFHISHKLRFFHISGKNPLPKLIKLWALISSSSNRELYISFRRYLRLSIYIFEKQILYNRMRHSRAEENLIARIRNHIARVFRTLGRRECPVVSHCRQLKIWENLRSYFSIQFLQVG
jgi:hypothetical protein